MNDSYSHGCWCFNTLSLKKNVSKAFYWQKMYGSSVEEKDDFLMTFCQSRDTPLSELSLNKEIAKYPNVSPPCPTIPNCCVHVICVFFWWLRAKNKSGMWYIFYLFSDCFLYVCGKLNKCSFFFAIAALSRTKCISYSGSRAHHHPSLRFHNEVWLCNLFAFLAGSSCLPNLVFSEK